MRPSWTMLILLIGVLLTSSGFGLWDCMINNGGQTTAQGGPFDRHFEWRSSFEPGDYFGRVRAEANRIIYEISAHSQGQDVCHGSTQTDWDLRYTLRDTDVVTFIGEGGYNDAAWDCLVTPHTLNWFYSGDVSECLPFLRDP